MKEQDRYLHIRNTYIDNAHGAGALVIETELPLPATGKTGENPQFDTLLTEIHSLKARNPAMFADVRTVEIRHIDTPCSAKKDEMTLKFVQEASKLGLENPIL